MRAHETQADADLALMRRVSAGEEQAAEELYDRFASLVYRLAVQAMPTRADRRTQCGGFHPLVADGRPI